MEMARLIYLLAQMRCRHAARCDGDDRSGAGAAGGEAEARERRVGWRTAVARLQVGAPADESPRRTRENRMRRGSAQEGTSAALSS